MEQYIRHSSEQSVWSDKDADNCKSTTGFDCNICLDSVQDPVVTFCGHLYCWPCIYMWIHSQSQRSSSFPDSEIHTDCPVCKTDVTLNTLIPLYGPGKSARGNKARQVGPVIPQRPNGPGCGVHTLISQAHQRQQVYPYSYSTTMPTFGFAGTTTFQPMIGTFGEMIFARIFGNSETTIYRYPNTYSIGGTSSARVRRHVMQVDRSLSRVSFFLCCCIILCLLLF